MERISWKLKAMIGICCPTSILCVIVGLALIPIHLPSNRVDVKNRSMTSKVLITGDNGGSGGILSSVELYDLSTGTWSITGNMNIGRYYHRSCVSTNDNALVTGRDSAEVYDLSMRIWTSIDSMNDKRHSHELSLLKNEQMLAVNGNPDSDYN